jgi:hypothetical protein
LSIVEAAAVAVEAGLTQQPDPQSGLPGARFADQQDIAGTAQEVQPGQDLDLCLVPTRGKKDSWGLIPKTSHPLSGSCMAHPIRGAGR